MAHTHSVIDDDLYFTIDPTTREIDNGSQKVKLMQYDHNSEQLTFELPRFVEGHDMSLCNSIRVNYININKSTRVQNPGAYEVNDMQVEADNVTFTWLISRNATQYVGPLNFLIKFMCFDEYGNAIYEWHTDIFKNASVYTGMNNEESIVEEYADILEQWKNEVLTKAGTVKSVNSIEPDENGDVTIEIPEGFSGDYNDLINIPTQNVQLIESLDFDNMVNLRDLDSGSYILYGKFKPYSGSDSTMTFGSNLLVNILKSTSTSKVQIFYPNNNCVQYLKITDDTYERTNVYLNDLESTGNRVTSIDESSDDTHYPTAKAVYTAIETMTVSESEIEELIASIS